MNDHPLNLLCKACGLCCSGHLFAWVRLDATELDRVEALGLTVIRDDPRQRGFLQPCRAWNGSCSVYTSPDYPRSCARYKCKQFKEVADQKTTLPESLEKIQQAHALIAALTVELTQVTGNSFRERLLTKMEDRTAENKEFREKAHDLIAYFEDFFGVMDFID